MVGWVVELSAQWLVWRSQVVVVLVYGGLWASGVGWWAVVVGVGVVLGVVVAMVVGLGVVLLVVVSVLVGVLVVLVVVVEWVVVVVLWARPQDRLVFRWDVGVGHRLEPLVRHSLVDGSAGSGASLGRSQPGLRGLPRGTILLVASAVPKNPHMAMHTLHQRGGAARLRERLTSLQSWASTVTGAEV